MRPAAPGHVQAVKLLLSCCGNDMHISNGFGPGRAPLHTVLFNGTSFSAMETPELVNVQRQPFRREKIRPRASCSCWSREEAAT
jgi:hypothetical protein